LQEVNVNSAKFSGKVTKVYKSGFVCEIPPRTEKGFPTAVWVKQSESAAMPPLGQEVVIDAALSTSKGKEGAPPQLCVYAFEVIGVDKHTADPKTKSEEDDIPF
jgi:hypothetical protein